MAKWTKEENIREAGFWLAKKIELIEEKQQLLTKQNEMMQKTSRYTPIKTVYRGSVYWAELGNGNIGGEKNKKRPVIVLSPNRLNKGNTVVVAPLSKQFNKKESGMPLYKNHYLLKKKDYPKLDRDSVIKFEDIRSIDVVRIREPIFDVNKNDMLKMKERLLFMYGY